MSDLPLFLYNQIPQGTKLTFSLILRLCSMATTT